MTESQNFSNKRILIVYHSEDNDGTFSAAIVFKWITEHLNASKDLITLCPSTYNTLEKANNDMDGDIVNYWKSLYDIVIMTDISFNSVHVMKDLKNVFGNNFVWIDHHAPIIKESMKKHFDSIPGLRNTTHSALYLAYQYLYDPLKEKIIHNEIPELLKILSAWDSWSYEREGYTLQYVMQVNKAISMMTKVEFDGALSIVNQIMNEYGKKTAKDIEKTVIANKTGTTICEYDKMCWENLMKNNVEKGWKVCGRNAAALFTQGPSTSQMFDFIKDEVQIGIVFKKVPNEDKWVVSMYNTSVDYDKDFNCGAYLKEYYKGGGHKGAAGCTISTRQFNKIVKNKSL